MSHLMLLVKCLTEKTKLLTVAVTFPTLLKSWLKSGYLRICFTVYSRHLEACSDS